MKKLSSVLTIGQRLNPVNERLLSVKEAADQLRVSTSWLYQSNIPRVKLGARRLYRPSDLAEYVDSRVSHRLNTEEK